MEDTFAQLKHFVLSVPGVRDFIQKGYDENGQWWIQFAVNPEHPLSWRVVQEFAFVINYLSLGERLPAVFFPISSPPYLNGGPDEYLYWIIQSSGSTFSPDMCADWLTKRFPNPIDDEAQWNLDD
jgi:hypothetical protein